MLDGQARQIRAAILRQQGNDGEAEAMLTRALDELIAIRGGRIAATIWLRAQIFGDLAGIAEGRNDRAAAETRHREALANLQYGIAARKSLTLLLGEAGTGKTTLVHAALGSDACRSARILGVNPRIS